VRGDGQLLQTPGLQMEGAEVARRQRQAKVRQRVLARKVCEWIRRSKK